MGTEGPRDEDKCSASASACACACEEEILELECLLGLVAARMQIKIKYK